MDHAIMYLILNRFKLNNNFEMSPDEFKELLKGNVTIPLFEDRYSNLDEMNNLLKRSGKSFYKLTKDLNVDSQLFEFIVSNLDYFKDVSTYDGEEILFYKRAQLLTSDILQVREKKEKIDVDYSHLIGCADYKISQVMRYYGMLGFSDSLADRVDSTVEIEEGSKEEVEIIANTLKVIDYIYETLFIIMSGIIGIIIGHRSNNFKIVKSIVYGLIIYITFSALSLSILYISGLIDPSIMSLFNNIKISSSSMKKMLIIGILEYFIYIILMYILGNKLLNKGVNVD